MRLPIWLATGLVASLGWGSAADAIDVAAPTLAQCDRAASLHPASAPDTAPLLALPRGVNLTNTFDADVSPARTGADLARLAELGFHHVRIPIEHEMRDPTSRNAPDGRLKRLDETVCAAVSMGLAVILDCMRTATP